MIFGWLYCVYMYHCGSEGGGVRSLGINGMQVSIQVRVFPLDSKRYKIFLL